MKSVLRQVWARALMVMIVGMLAACSPSGDGEVQLLPIATPDTVGLSQSGAESAIRGAGLEVGTVTVESSNSVAAGSVISQDPPAGTDLPQGSTVDLIVSGGPADVPVPNTAGLSQAEAEAAIVAAGFVVGTVITEASDTVALGGVIRTSPPASDLLAPGSTINLVVSAGPNNTPVPNVAGLSEADARDAILMAGLTIGNVTGEASDVVPVGNVIRTDPLVGTEITAGAPVDIIVSLGPANVAVPDVTNLTSAAAAQALIDAGLIVGDVTFAVSVDVPAGSIISQDPAAAALVAAGTAVNLVESLGPDAVPVPDIVGLQQADAESVVTTAGLAVGNIGLQVSTLVPEGEVLSQSIPPGTQVIPGTTLDFVVSIGPPVTVPDVTGLSEADASTTLVDARLVVGNVTTQEDLNVPAGAVISQNPAGGAVVDPGTAVDLVVSLGPPTTVTPGVIGLMQMAAEQAIIDAELIVGTVTQQPSNTIAAGVVISQSPAAGAVLVVGSPVDLVVSSGPPQATVPDVVGLTEAAAGTTLNNAGLVTGNVTQQSSSSVPAGQIISQNPAAGLQVNAGSAVDLVVSSGPASVSVPNVVGLSQAAASSAITGANLVVGNVTTQTSNTVANGDVISQNPTGGTTVSEGSAVDLVVSSGPATVSVPNVVGQSQAAAEAAITGASLVVGAVSNASSNTVASGDVISQDPAAGTNVAENSAVNIVVSTGPATSSFTDEFNDASSLSDWSLRHQVEGTNQQYSTLDIDTSRAGYLVLIPSVRSGWFATGRAPLVFKEITGNFAVQTYVVARSLGSASVAPASEFNSAGLLARNPAGATGSENYVMVNLGRQDTRIPGSVGSEAKTTVNDFSTLTLDAAGFEGDILLCRVGNEMIAYRRLAADPDWVELDRYTRADLPATLQVGLVVNAFQTPIDIRAEFDYIRELPTPSNDTQCTP
ncbi:MAG: PASTA domain-containing protein [Pseudomonadota bacterium]